MGGIELANNNKLITTAASTVLVANGTDDVFVSQGIATAFVVTDGTVGDDTILTFRKNDSLINYRALGDTVVPGANGTIAVDGPGAASSDDIQIIGADGDSVLTLRYLGTKDGGFAYADASVRLAGFTEGYVTDDSFNAGSAATTYFYDNALGLNLGFDTINGFGADDRIVTTRRIYDGNDSASIEFGGNKVLDLSGEGGPKATDGQLNPGGQIDVNGTTGDIVSLDFLFEENVGGVTYYYYGIDA